MFHRRIRPFTLGIALVTGATSRRRWLLCVWFALPGLLAIAWLVVTDAQAAVRRASVQTYSLLVSDVLPAGQIAVASDRCPASHPHPVGPQFYDNGAPSAAGSVALTASYPVGRNGWKTEVANRSNEPQKVDLGILCVRADASFAYPRTRNNVAGNGGVSVSSSICPSSAPHPIGEYFGAGSSANLGELLLSDAYVFSGHKGQAFVTGVRSLSPAAVSFFVGAVCTSLRSVNPEFRHTVPAGQSLDIAVYCPRRTPIPVSATFYAYVPKHDGSGSVTDQVTMDLTYSYASDAWAIGANNVTDHTVRDVLGAICVGG